MKINVGSLNQTKIGTVRDATILYPRLFPDPEVLGVKINVDVYGHPKNISETVEGAIKRARDAFRDCDFSFGLEGGLMAVPFTKTGFMEINACAIFDGKNVYLGLSPAFEWPKPVTDLILAGKADARLAFKQLGLTNHNKIGEVKGGIIGPLTNNRITREDFMRYSIIMAMIHLEKPEFYLQNI
jgi:inosine/xanthosine triphosphatase